jgi:hypothetical protein
MTMQTLNHIFDAWPNTAEMARDLELDYFTVRQWKSRNSIPGRHWERVSIAYRSRTNEPLIIDGPRA